jgi:nitroreductase
MKKKVAAACGDQLWMADADCIIIALGLASVSGNWYKVDVAIAMENMVLAAKSLGYGTCWIGNFNAARLKDICAVPADIDVVACSPLGVPNVAPASRERKPWEQVFSADSFGKPMILDE